MKHFLAFFLLSIFLSTKAQESVLSITGSASVTVKPTITIITMEIRSTKDAYTDAIESMIARIDLLTKDMKKAGFKEKEIVTSNFNINKRINYTQNRTQQEVFDATQVLRVEFPQDKDQLLKVLNQATASKAQPEISISFNLDIDKKKEVKANLIRLAIKDAKEKGALIAGETTYEITGIKNISYGQSRFSPGPLSFNETERSMSMENVIITNMEVANLTFSESVDVAYLLQKQ